MPHTHSLRSLKGRMSMDSIAGNTHMHLHRQNTDTVVQRCLLKKVTCICNCIFMNDCLLTIKRAVVKESVEVSWVQVKESFPQLWLTSLVSHKRRAPSCLVLSCSYWSCVPAGFCTLIKPTLLIPVMMITGQESRWAFSEGWCQSKSFWTNRLTRRRDDKPQMTKSVHRLDSVPLYCLHWEHLTSAPLTQHHTDPFSLLSTGRHIVQSHYWHLIILCWSHDLTQSLNLTFKITSLNLI